MGFVLALSGGSKLFVNGAMAFVGKVSFSAYLLHFAVLHLVEALPGLLHTQATSYAAILAYAGGFVFTVAVTAAGALLSYRIVEQPMIGLGKWLIKRSRRQYSPA
jgi:peptidoglycan/LPS O-acetylase OafA/YrhL